MVVDNSDANFGAHRQKPVPGDVTYGDCTGMSRWAPPEESSHMPQQPTHYLEDLVFRELCLLKASDLANKIGKPRNVFIQR